MTEPFLNSNAPDFVCLRIWARLALTVVAMAVTYPAHSQAPPAQAPGLKIQILKGEGAINYAKARTGHEVIVEVTDTNNRPVSGASVSFLLPQGGPGGTFANGAQNLTVVTNAKGQAVLSALRPNNVAGPFQIQVHASYHGLMANATVTQTNPAAASSAASAGISGKVIAIIAVAAAGAATGAVVATRGGGSPAPPAPPSPTAVTATVGSATFGTPR
jgi:hypothetical protein